MKNKNDKFSEENQRKNLEELKKKIGVSTIAITKEQETEAKEEFLK